MGGGAEGSYELFGESEERDRHGKVERLIQVGDPAPPGSSMRGAANYVVADAIHLADCILEEREPLIGAEHGRHVVEIIEQVYESARSVDASIWRRRFHGTEICVGSQAPIGLLKTSCGSPASARRRSPNWSRRVAATRRSNRCARRSATLE